MQTQRARTFRLAVSAATIALVFATGARGGDSIFADNFETGDSCRWSSTSPALAPGACADPEVLRFSGFHLNEITVDAISRGVVDDTAPPPFQRLEIYYWGEVDGDLDGASLELADAGASAALPSVSMPPGSFLTVSLLPAGTTAGDFGLTSDLDFGDDEGSWYVDAGGFFAEAGDDVALVQGGVTLAFLAYGDPFGAPTSLETAAVTDGVWTAGERVDTSSLGRGESIALRLDGFYDSLATVGAGLGASAPVAEDYLSVDWTRQTLGMQQPSQPLQVSPGDGALFAALPVELEWQECPGALQYRLELRDDPDLPTVTTLRTTSSNSYTVKAADVSFDPVYWTVACRYDEGAARSPFPRPWVFGTGTSTAGATAVTLAVPHQYQRKDSDMLCLYDFKKGGGQGCAETLAGPDGPCDWDDPHVVTSPAAVKACGPYGENNCVRASIQMVHDFLSGGVSTIAQDYISFLVFEDSAPPGPAVAGDPEGDLGAGVGMTVAQTVSALADVLQVATGAIDVDFDPTFSEIRAFLDAGRPVIIFRWWPRGGGHATVIYGYQLTPTNAVFVHDPTLGTQAVRYSDYRQNGLRSLDPIYAIVPPAVAASATGNPPNVLHPDVSAFVFDTFGDADGVTSFDEIYRFATHPDNPDTDFDQVFDLEEVHSYTFPLGPDTFTMRPPDIDVDGKRPELDCDTDSAANVTGGWSADHDGGEDIDGDGDGGLGTGETDQFLAAFGHQALSLDKAEYMLGEEVHLLGGTVAGLYSYPTDTRACPPLAPGAPIGGGPPFSTGPLGFGDSVVFVCEMPGCYITYLDLADDGTWLHSLRACDLSFPFTCQPCPHPDPEGDFFDPAGDSPAIPIEIDDIIGLENNSLQEVDFVVLTEPGPAGRQADPRIELVFSIANPPGAPSSAPPQTAGGFIWLDAQFAATPVLDWWLWQPGVGWQAEPGLGAEIGVQLHPDGRLEVSADNPVEIQLEELSLTGVRVITHGSGFLDAMPDPDLSGGPPVFVEMLPLDQCQ